MKFLPIFLMISAIGLNGCSSTSDEEKTGPVAMQESEFSGEETLSDDELGSSELDSELTAETDKDNTTVEQLAEESVTEGSTPVTDTESSIASEAPPRLAEDEVRESSLEEAPITETTASETQTFTSDANQVDIDQSSSSEYHVKNGETLMLISFKIYGDYRNWRDLANKNPGKIGKNYHVAPGTKLAYTPPSVPFEWNPKGNPYLIKTGDTLGIISNTVYGTKSKWKFIWENNKPMILDPNIIFAGFTLYYRQLGDIAYNK